MVLPRNKSKGRKNGATVVGLDPSIVKTSELFGVDLKMVNRLEKDPALLNLGKHIITMFLEYIDDVKAYLLHANHKTNESLGNFVEVVTDLQHHCQGRKEGIKDIGWKVKSRNAIEYIKPPTN